MRNAKCEMRMALFVVELAIDFGDEKGDDFVEQFNAVLVNFGR